MNTRILIAVVLAMFVCQQVYAQEDGEPEVKELEGTWEVESVTVDGEQADFPDGTQMRFEGNRMYRRVGDDEDWRLSGPFSLDLSAVPAEIDLGSDEFDVAIIRGIYELDGDTLTFCLGELGEARPDNFESTEDPPTMLMVFRRVEEDDE